MLGRSVYREDNMLLDKYKLVIFDWDGTLSTSTPIARAARFTKIRYSLSDIEKKRHLYKKVKFKDDMRTEEVSRLYAFIYDMYSYFYKPRLKEGVIELMKRLRKLGKRIAIFRDSNRYRLYDETKKLGIGLYVDYILSADTIKRFKPNPTGLISIARRFRVKKNECLYVGDMAVDVYTARFAGIDSCAVANGVDPYKLLKEVKPNYLLRNIESLLKTKN